MRPASLITFSIMLLAAISCNPSRPDNTMLVLVYKGQPQKYRPANNATHTITGVIKSEVGRELVSLASVELYYENDFSNYLLTTTTSQRGKFTFTVNNGVYRLVLSHSNYKEKDVLVTVNGWDIDLDEIKITPYTY